MVNQRRRRTIIVLITGVFILISQLPNLLNIVHPWQEQQRAEPNRRLAEELDALQRSFSSGKIPAADFQRRQQEIVRAQRAQNAHTAELNRQSWEQKHGPAPQPGLASRVASLGRYDLSGGPNLAGIAGHSGKSLP